MSYAAQRHHMMTLSHDQGIHVKAFYSKYDMFLARAEEEFYRESRDYQRFQAEYQFWRENCMKQTDDRNEALEDVLTMK